MIKGVLKCDWRSPTGHLYLRGETAEVPEEAAHLIEGGKRIKAKPAGEVVTKPAELLTDRQTRPRQRTRKRK